MPDLLPIRHSGDKTIIKRAAAANKVVQDGYSLNLRETDTDASTNNRTMLFLIVVKTLPAVRRFIQPNRLDALEAKNTDATPGFCPRVSPYWPPVRTFLKKVV